MARTREEPKTEQEKLRQSRDEQQKLEREAKAEDVALPHPRAFLREAVRWGIPMATAVAAAENASNYAHAKAIRASDKSLDPSGLPTYAEIAPLTLKTPLPKAWGAPDVIVKEATIDPVAAAVTRPRNWGEAHSVVERGRRVFVACSDGMNFFDTSKVEEIEKEALVIAILDGSDIPSDDAEI